MCLGQVNQPTSEIHCDSGDGTERIHSFQICLQKGEDDGLQSQKKLEQWQPHNELRACISVRTGPVAERLRYPF